MATVLGADGPRPLVESLRQYVLEPVRAAESLAATERREVAAERAAFERFRETVEQVEPVSQSGDPRPLATGPNGRTGATVRAGYRETVMAVDHYESVYDEPMGENMASELGNDIACALHPDSSVAFTTPVKRRVLASVADCVEERDALESAVAAECDSLAASRDDVQEVVGPLDGGVVPDWYRDRFREALDDVAARRQEYLRGITRFDGHEFCGYLYADRPWRFPVLTAVARLREAAPVAD